MDNEEKILSALDALAAGVYRRLDGVDRRLDKIESDIVEVKADIVEIKYEATETRGVANQILDWVEEASEKVHVPLFSREISAVALELAS